MVQWAETHALHEGARFSGTARSLGTEPRAAPLALLVVVT